MQTETERLRTITLAVPANEAGRLFIQALHHLVPTALDTGGDTLIFGPPVPDGAFPVTRAEATAVVRPTIIFGMEHSIDLAVGPLHLCSTPTAVGDKRPPAEGAEAKVVQRSDATIPGAHPLPLTVLPTT